jgi:hypothetical protein
MKNEFISALLADQDFLKGLSSSLIAGPNSLFKADTVSTATGLNWYDLRPVVQLLYPYKELIPLISRLPRVSGAGGTGFHWKRIVGVNIGNLSLGVGEGQRAARIAISEQDQQGVYKTLGLESSVTFQAGWANGQLTPNNRAIATQSTLRSVMIGEEQTLILGNATQALATTPTPTLTTNTGATNGTWGATVSVYVICVALTGFGLLNYQPFNASTGIGGVPGQVTKVNADGSTDTYGGGSAKPSAEASVSGVTTAQTVTAVVTPIAGAVAYAWYVGTTSGAETLAGITSVSRATFTKPGALVQPVTNLQVSGLYQDNSVNAYLFDGIIPMMTNAIFGSAPGTPMATNSQLPSVVSSGDTLTITNAGSLVYTMHNTNTGLTISGTNVAEWDVLLQGAYDQYKIGFDRILMSSQDISYNAGAFFASGAAAQFKILFDAESDTGRITAGRRVNSYLNKFFNNSLDIEIHPYIPVGTVIFWSDRIPYELSGIANILEMHVRQDYYEVQWPWATMRHEFGVYVDELAAGFFMPAFAMIVNLNSAAVSPSF